MGNKADLIESRATTEEEAKQFASSNGMLYFETSAKEDLNIDDAFLCIARNALKNEQQEDLFQPLPDNINVNAKPGAKASGSCC